MLVAALVSGFLMAFFGSMPPTGPIAVLVLQRGVFRKYREGLAIAFGAALPEGVYSALAVFGLSALFERFPAVEWIARIVGVVILLALGIHFIRFKAAKEDPTDPHAESRGVQRSFFLGFWIAAANPVLILTWSTSVAMLVSLGGLHFGIVDKVAFALAVAAGVVAWFWIMTLTLRRHSDVFTVRVAQKIIRGAGIGMVGMAILFAGKLILARAQMF